MTQSHKLWENQVCVNILTHNRREVLFEGLHQLIQMGIEEEAIIVVDNGSVDGTSEMLASHYPKVPLVALEHNEGTSAWNYGFIKASREIILVLDDDAIPIKGSCQEAIRLLDTHEDIGIVACRVSNHQYGHFWHTPYQPSEVSGLTDYFIFIGCAFFVRRSIVCRGNVFDTTLFAHDHEYPLAVQCFQSGWRIVYHPKVCALHRFNEAMGKRDESLTTNIKMLHARNAAYFLFCTGGAYTKAKVALWLFLQWLCLINHYPMKSDTVKLLWAFFLGFIHSLKSRKRYWPAPIRKMLLIWEWVFPHLSFPLPQTFWMPWNEPVSQWGGNTFDWKPQRGQEG